jgi:hypothetical protein
MGVVAPLPKIWIQFCEYRALPMISPRKERCSARLPTHAVITTQNASTIMADGSSRAARRR